MTQTSPIREALEPCPFCGKPPRICPDTSYGSATVFCPDANDCLVAPTADADLNIGETVDDAIRRWNTRQSLSQTTEGMGWREAVIKIAQAAHVIGWQAGVGGMETAGAIVSYLANHPDQIEPFFRDEVSPIDWPDFINGGCLTWHAQGDGKIVHPSEVRASSNEGEIEA